MVPRNKRNTINQAVAKKTSKATADQIVRTIKKLHDRKISSSGAENMIAKQIATEMSSSIPRLPIVKNVAKGIVKLP